MSFDQSQPSFLVHYNRGEPFRSLTAVPNEKLTTILCALNETNSWGLNRFSDPDYLIRRKQVEAKIRQEFIMKGGNPILDNPIYFFLGRNNRFEEHPLNQGYM